MPPFPPTVPPPTPSSGYPPAGGYPSPAPRPSSSTWGAASAKNWMGIVSLVLGLTCVASGIIGAIFGHLGLAACARGEANNRGIALAGVIVNYMILVLGLTGLAIVVAADANSPSSTPTHTSGFATRAMEEASPSDDAGLAIRALDTTLTKSNDLYDLTIGDCVTNV